MKHEYRGRNRRRRIGRLVLRQAPSGAGRFLRRVRSRGPHRRPRRDGRSGGLQTGPRLPSPPGFVSRGAREPRPRRDGGATVRARRTGSKRRSVLARRRPVALSGPRIDDVARTVRDARGRAPHDDASQSRSRRVSRRRSAERARAARGARVLRITEAELLSPVLRRGSRSTPSSRFRRGTSCRCSAGSPKAVPCSPRTACKRFRTNSRLRSPKRAFG